MANTISVTFHNETFDVRISTHETTFAKERRTLSMCIFATRRQLEHLAVQAYNADGSEAMSAFTLPHDVRYGKECHYTDVHLKEGQSVRVFQYQPNMPDGQDIFGIWERQGDDFIKVA